MLVAGRADGGQGQPPGPFEVAPASTLLLPPYPEAGIHGTAAPSPFCHAPLSAMGCP